VFTKPKVQSIATSHQTISLATSLEHCLSMAGLRLLSRSTVLISPCCSVDVYEDVTEHENVYQDETEQGGEEEILLRPEENK